MAKLDNVRVPCCIASIDQPSWRVEAQFNPKELSMDKQVPWQKHEQSRGDAPKMEFTGAQPSKLSVELFFDGYEEKLNVYQAFVSRLEYLTTVRDMGDDDLRPHRCMFVWGHETKGFPRFDGVIESMSTKYTMFLHDGTPCRATVTLKLTRAADAHRKAESNSGGGGGGGGGGGQ